jgi:thiol-disulfide isomerase/thioredoxin
MNSKNIFISLLLIVAGVFFYRLFFSNAEIRVGSKAPAIEGTLISGETFNSEELKGDYLLIDFWGTWCGPCIKEIPKLKALYDSYSSARFEDGSKFEIVSIALEKSDKYAKQIIEKRGMDWPFHIIDISQFVLLSKHAQQFGVTELPANFLLNPNGEIMAINQPLEQVGQILSSRLVED